MTSGKGQEPTRVDETMAQAGIHLDVEATDKCGLFEKVAVLVAPRLGIAPPAIAKALRARERLGSTALGYGFALPHARLGGLALPAVEYVRVRLPLPFDAPDDRPVTELIFLFVPEAATDAHLQLLAGIADMLSHPGVRAELQGSPDAAAVRRVLAARERPPGTRLP
jgi:PTS system nitrogen regulatory IIA component